MPQMILTFHTGTISQIQCWKQTRPPGKVSDRKKPTTMKENWIKIYSSQDLVKVKIAEDVLKQNGIESHILNKPDSMLPMLGEAELYTLPEKAEAARKVLQENDMLD
jgi:uncharacterized protein YbaA (DUF1428 family)